MAGVSGLPRAGQAALDRPIVSEIDGDCTASDVIAILQDLHFPTGFTTIQIRDCRDFLVASILAPAR